MARRGHDRERRVRKFLEDDDWVVVRSAGSLGPIDLVALKLGMKTQLIEVKSTARSPWEHFKPADRQEMLLIAEQAGAEAWLAWWPPRGSLRWLKSSEWP